MIPVRETEAWALADGDALRAAFGCARDDTALGVPRRAHEVERNSLPKESFEKAYATSKGHRRGKRRSASGFLQVLGERVSLERLRQVPAFQRLETALLQSLRDLGYLHT